MIRARVEAAKNIKSAAAHRKNLRSRPQRMLSNSD